MPIFDLAPRLHSRPFIPIAHAPTDVDVLAGYEGRVFVKRDDRVSPLYGGNKVRRWEWLLGEAQSRGARTLLTVGGLGSTQVTSLVTHGRAHGFEVACVLFDQPDTAFVHEALDLDAARGAELTLGRGYGRTAALAVKRAIARPRPYLVAPGASGPLANLSYVDAMLEVGAQVERGELPRPDRIVVACGSGGTTAGLAVGCAILGWKTVVVGVRITDLIASNPLTLRLLARGTERLLRREGARLPRSLDLQMAMDHRFIGPGYGYSTPEAEAGARAYARHFGAPGEVTYSGKAMAALDVIARERPGEILLFWNTLSTTGRGPVTGEVASQGGTGG